MLTIIIQSSYYHTNFWGNLYNYEAILFIWNAGYPKGKYETNTGKITLFSQEICSSKPSQQCSDGVDVVCQGSQYLIRDRTGGKLKLMHC